MYRTPDPVTLPPDPGQRLDSGAVVINTWKDPRDNYLWLVLAQLPPRKVPGAYLDDGSYHRFPSYAVWLYNGCHDGCYEGGYHTSPCDAIADYEARKLQANEHYWESAEMWEQFIGVLACSALGAARGEA